MSTGAPESAPRPRKRLLRGLSARLLLLTAAFVLLSEALLFLPSLAHRRHDLLREKAREAELVALAAEGRLAPTTQALLRDLGEYAALAVVDGPARLELLAAPAQPGAGPLMQADLRQPFWRPAHVRDSLRLLLVPDPPAVRLAHRMRTGQVLEAVVGQRQIAHELREFAATMLVVSLVVSLLTGLLVFVVIHRVMVRPIRRLSEAITRFRAAPEAPTQPDPGLAGGGEVGEAARAFAAMRTDLRAALWQQARLAALGQAVAKISHDLRNILTTALLVADRLERSDDPNVRRAAPMLVDAIGRAAQLARGTLDFAREGRPALDPVPLTLAGLLREAAVAAAVPPETVAIRFPPGLGLVADRVQLGRALSNLLRNAVQSGAGRVTVEAAREDGMTVLRLRDDGPGLPDPVRARLFQPFAASTSQGGAGLGLAIARDVLRAHGGDIVLDSTGPGGTCFRLTLPDQAAGQAPTLPEALVAPPGPADPFLAAPPPEPAPRRDPALVSR